MVISEIQQLHESQPKREKKQKTSFYRTKAWRQKRYEILVAQRKEYGVNFNFCTLCGVTTINKDKEGKPVVMTVEHLKPRSKYPELALVNTNLDVRCWDCNYGKGVLEIE